MESELVVRPKSHLTPLILALILVLGGASYFYLRITYPFLFNNLNSAVANLQTKLSKLTTSTPSPTNSVANTQPAEPVPYVLPTGTQTYVFTHGEGVKGPKIKSVIIDPLDPKDGTQQIFTLQIDSEPPLVSGSLIVSTDNRARTLNLKLMDGDARSGTYTTSWEVNDSFDSVYAIKYILKSSTHTYDNTMYLRQ